MLYERMTGDRHFRELAAEARDWIFALKFESFGDDDLARFQSEAGVYHDLFADFSTNEPIIDGTVSLILLLSVWR